MTLNEPLFLEMLWDAILSRETEKITDAFKTLSRDEQAGILIHLERMTSEDGWHPDQVQSAQTALNVIQKMRSDK